MPSKRFWIITGMLVAGAGITTVAAHGLKHVHDRGGYHNYSDGGDDVLPGRHRGWWGGSSITKEDFDARTRARFARMDSNSDGIINADEARKGIEARMERGRGGYKRRRVERFAQRILRRFDINKDGKVTAQERESRIAEMFARFDLDSDGRITDADLPPMLRGRGLLGGNTPRGDRAPRRAFRGMRFLFGADTDGDNMITLEEAQAAAAKRFARWDLNKDDAIDRADMQGRREEALACRVKRFMHRYGGLKNGQVTQSQFKAFHAERFARLDYDNNGKLTRDEMPARRWRKMFKRWHHHGGGPGMFDGSRDDYGRQSQEGNGEARPQPRGSQSGNEQQL